MIHGMRKYRSPFGILVLFLLIILSPGLINDAHAEELRLRVRLLWGSDDHPSQHPKLKEVHPSLAEKLKMVFKWKHYFKVNEKQVSVSDGKSARTVLSEKCEVEVKNEGNSMLLVKLYGEGKLMNQHRQHMPEDCLVIGGRDKNYTAWFVVITKQ